MVDIGTPDTKRVNARSTKLFIRPSSTDLEYLQLQDKNLRVSHPSSVEPTTSAGIAVYSGALNGSLTGTLLFTNDMVAAVGGYTELSTPVNGQLPTKTWKLKLTDFGSTEQVWTVSAILEDFSIDGPAEGGTKYSISMRLTAEPTVA